jgi:hypothetical protein
LALSEIARRQDSWRVVFISWANDRFQPHQID